MSDPNSEIIMVAQPKVPDLKVTSLSGQFDQIEGRTSSPAMDANIFEMSGGGGSHDASEIGCFYETVFTSDPGSSHPRHPHGHIEGQGPACFVRDEDCIRGPEDDMPQLPERFGEVIPSVQPVDVIP